MQQHKQQLLQQQAALVAKQVKVSLRKNSMLVTSWKAELVPLNPFHHKDYIMLMARAKGASTLLDITWDPSSSVIIRATENA